MARNILECHVMKDNNLEVGHAKAKIYDQDFNWNKRIFVIDHDKIIKDHKGKFHFYVDVNDTVGGLSFDKSHTDKCSICSKQISIDAQNAKDLVKRKTIKALWGIDNSHITLLLIMGIVLVMLMGALFYVIGELNKTNQTLQRFLPQPNAGSSVTAKLILPMEIMVK